MNLRYAPRALRDIDEILAYINARSPQGARNVSLAIEHSIGMCAQNPATGSKADEPDLYRRTLGKYRYTIFYRVDLTADVVEIARVVHSARVKNLGALPEDG